MPAANQKQKTAELVKEAFQSVEGSLEDIRLFHTDRGNEFKNQTIEEVLETFHIERSLSHKGCPYDNAVAEATFKIIKTEFVWNETFTDLRELKLKLWDYIHWYHHRIRLFKERICTVKCSSHPQVLGMVEESLSESGTSSGFSHR